MTNDLTIVTTLFHFTFYFEFVFLDLYGVCLVLSPVNSVFSNVVFCRQLLNLINDLNCKQSCKLYIF